MKKAPIVATLLATLLLGFVAVAAFAGGDEEREVREIVIQHVGDGIEIEAGGLHWLHATSGHLELMGAHGGGFLGVQLSELTPELRAHFGVPEDVGVLVSKVVEGSPARRAGVQVGDVLTRIDGEDVDSARAIQHLVAGHEDGEEALIELWRDGAVQTLAATIEEREGRHEEHFFPHLRLRHGEGCDGGEDCEDAVDLQLGCGDGCEIRIECSDGDCECSKNGEGVDCEELHERFNLHRRHHE